MAESILAQIDQLRLSITGLEAQRSILGDAIVNPALAALQKQLAELEQQSAQQAAPADERRMVTILFIDMVGSTSMAENLDPEEWRKVISQVHAALGETINAHHGTVAQFLGDGILAFFGSKETSEHDPENAVRAALEAHTAIASSGIGENVQIRAGIHTGLVVVGELGNSAHKEFTASGDAMNLAARLQSAAPAGGTLISQDTYRYVRGVFDMTSRPPLSVKGKSEPLQTYLVRRAKPRPFRSISRGVAGVETRTIGREPEMQALQQAYLRAYEGHGTAWAQLLGDPGVGKSRLVADLSDWIDLRDETSRLMRGRAFPDDANQPFALVRRLWFDRFQIAEDAPLAQAEAKWVERFKEFSGMENYEEPAHALGLLVGLPFENSTHIKGMRNDPNQVKGRALVVSRKMIESVRKEYPVVVLLEDLQWSDAASWEYLMEVFLDDTPGEHANGVFVLGAARPEWQPPEKLVDLLKSSSPGEETRNLWGRLINLEPLTDKAIRELVLELLQRTQDVPEAVIEMLVERSEGIPYFTEEMINWFIDNEIIDTHSDNWCFVPEKLKAQPLPATLQHLLLTRLSSLSQPERAALQRGSIFGRRFWTGGVEALGVASGDETLGHLQPRGFVVAQPDSSFEGDTEWSFHQNLLQEVTYESVLKRERAALHKVAAGWLESQARQAGRLEEFAGLLGEHFLRSGELSKAVDWYMMAARRAYKQGAPREVCNFYTHALDLLPPIDKERRWQALIGREEALAVLGETDQENADILALIELAPAFEDENFLAEAYLRQANLLTRLGDDEVTTRVAREALAVARHCGNKAIEAKALSQIATTDPAGWKEPTVNLSLANEALKIARTLGDAAVLSLVLFRVAYFYNVTGDIAKSIPFQIEQIDLDHSLGNRIMEAIGLGNLCSAYTRLGLYKQARSVLEQSRSINEALGARRGFSYNLISMGDIYWKTGDYRKSRQMFEQALTEITSTRDLWGKTCILNGMGFLLLSMGDASGAARRFTEAHELGSKVVMPPLLCECTAGLAVCAVLQGQLDEAHTYALDAWKQLKELGMVGLENPGSVFRMMAETFDALGDAENLHSVLEIGHQALMEAADAINVPEWRQSFLENVPDNRAFLEMWERSQAS